MTQLNIYYGSVSAFSFFLVLIYLYRWHKHFDVHMTVAMIMIPAINLAYLLMYASETAEAATVALKIIYIGSCYLPWLTTMCIAGLCDIQVKKWVKLLSFLLNSLIYLSVLSLGYLPLYYKSLVIEHIDGAMVMVKEYGPFHTVYYAALVLYLIADIGLILYSFKKQKQVPRRVLFLLFLPVFIAMMGAFLNHITMKRGFEILPLTYALAQIVYLLIAQRMAVYNVSEMVVDSLVESGETGFITMDFELRYLGSNVTARQILPDLNALIVDRPITQTKTLKATVGRWISDFRRAPKSRKDMLTHYTAMDASGKERIYSVTVNYLSDGRRRHGYQIFMEDDTQNQKYIALLDKFATELQKDVDAKTERIMEMHNRLILGMAMMVESRDNSTGGHIRRTSEAVRILIDEIRKGGTLQLSDTFCKNLIKAAPMHDLGKIAVDDAVLRKHGPFTPEERKKMQQHAAEGARIVHEILKDTDDDDFRRIAENVAHYHHEKVDGSGYPDGLKGDEIPLEARIMAVADVYDALVSKRVYKEKFSFEKANRIILEGMGTQFDPILKPYYEKARPRLEAYYSAE